MAHNATWQLAQELLIHIVEFLGDSHADLRACALVSRSFVHAAQSQIFQEISVGFGVTSVPHAHRLSTRLLETLHNSPHLAQHIHRLRLQPRRISSQTLSDICSFPFPRLRAMFCSNFILSPVAAIALRQLLALPTLHSVEIVCRDIPQRPVFIDMWSLCSPSIKHLDFTCDVVLGAFDPPDRLTAPARLTSLRVGNAGAVRDWVNHPLCPFDFSALTGLSVFIHAEVVHWPKLASIRQNITVFAFTAHPDMNVIDLSAFGSLEYLRIGLFSLAAWPTARAALSTITPLNKIRKIVLLGTFFGVDGDELDRTLTSLPLHYARVFELEMEPEYYDRTVASLPSTSDIRRTDDDPHWFKRMTRAL
ncbi:hypothetical protein B0H15DRAFT_295099 [Mycena belliarum]|uniref:F-box domain-containing protein n=1 Tax=Mycena belliarum TaxID=1033014 RepID=A0AAD6U3K9_9AGAR|nr:hypothetical protein B0H15DRAFT_295099 [Mycena belliae]